MAAVQPGALAPDPDHQQQQLGKISSKNPCKQLPTSFAQDYGNYQRVSLKRKLGESLTILNN
jgi:hypothetical protein